MPSASGNSTGSVKISGGGRGSAHYEKSPLEKYYDERLVADQSQRDAARVRTVAARQQERQAALKAGVPSSVLPSPTQVNTLSDEGWKEVSDRIGRFTKPEKTPAGSDATTKTSPPTPPSPNSLVSRESFRGFSQPQISGSGITAVDPETGRRVGVSPNAEQAMSLATGGKWDTMSPAERNQHLRQITGQNDRGFRYQLPVGDRGTLTVGNDNSRVVTSPYGSVRPAETANVSVPPQNKLITPPIQPTPIGAATATTPSPAPVAARPSDVLSGIASDPKFTAGLTTPARQTFPTTSGAQVPNLKLTNNQPAVNVPPAPPTTGEQAGRAVGSALRTADDVVSTGVPPDYKVETQPSVSPSERLFDVPGFVRGLTGDRAPEEKLKTPTTPTAPGDLDKDYLQRFATDDSYLSW